jgi:hypothetical protein
VSILCQLKKMQHAAGPWSDPASRAGAGGGGFLGLGLGGGGTGRRLFFFETSSLFFFGRSGSGRILGLGLRGEGEVSAFSPFLCLIFFSFSPL